MKKSRKFIVWIALPALLLIAASFIWGHSFKDHINPDLKAELQEYCKRNNLSQKHCVIVDFSIYSGKDRLFIVDLESNEILYSGLCAHGIGKNFDCIINPKFSNVNGSNYSCLGHFKIGVKRKATKFKLNCFELHGFDSSNSNAYTRGILIHDGMPAIKVIGMPCPPLSQGCFTITSTAFKKIDKLKNESSKPLLLYNTDTPIF